MISGSKFPNQCSHAVPRYEYGPYLRLYRPILHDLGGEELWQRGRDLQPLSGEIMTDLADIQTFIFYAVLGLSAMRFIGCTLYLLFNLFGF